MLHIENEYIRSHLLDGNFGLEKESLRVHADERFAHTPHPFPDDKHIVKDFCENQTEINTGVHKSARGAVDELVYHNERIFRRLQNLPEREYLWLFSNPPHIRSEEDIPIAVFEGRLSSKSAYRRYLAGKYGRYKMTFCGIHVNFSFSDDLLYADYEAALKEANARENAGTSASGLRPGGSASAPALGTSTGAAGAAASDSRSCSSAGAAASDLRPGGSLNATDAGEANGAALDFQTYKNRLYLDLAQHMAAFGWLLVAVTAASPVMDSSFVERGVYGKDVFTGMASVRCSEMGYWNEFSPILCYNDIRQYAESIRRYVEKGLLSAPSELYYPVRLKPAGENNLDSLCENGINHIELRMFDLNPLVDAGVEIRDILFAQLMMVWLSSIPYGSLTEKDQVQAVQNFKNASRYDLKTVNILTPDNEMYPVTAAAKKVIGMMRAFFQNVQIDVADILDFEEAKFTDADNRYAWKIRKEFGDGFSKKAMALAMRRQDPYRTA